MTFPTPASAPSYGPSLGRAACDGHPESPGKSELIVLTGGPGAGKTAILTIAQNLLCRHAVLIPESATIIFSGGFWRANTDAGLAATQTAIFHVQRQLERFAKEEGSALYGLCDRGTVDGAAYWPKGQGDFWASLGIDRQAEIGRYKAVIHLRTPPADQGYNRSNQYRLETAERAAEIDQAILAAWDGHPNRVVIDSQHSFDTKIKLALEAIHKNMNFPSA